MKLTSIATIVVILSLILPAMAELTEYQKGAMDGIEAAYKMGMAAQQVQDGKITIGDYNKMVENYNKGIQNIFAGNQTAISYLMSNQYSSSANSVSPYALSKYTTNKPIHEIDSSFDRTNRSVIGPQGGRIYDIPIDHYCTDNPNAAVCDYSNTPFYGSPSLGSV
jgi:hypothetical protein